MVHVKNNTKLKLFSLKYTLYTNMYYLKQQKNKDVNNDKNILRFENKTSFWKTLVVRQEKS